MARPGQAWDEGPVAGPPHGIQARRLPFWLILTWGALLTRAHPLVEGGEEGACQDDLSHLWFELLLFGLLS